MQSNVTEPPKMWDKRSPTVLTDSSKATFMEKHTIFNHFFSRHNLIIKISHGWSFIPSPSLVLPPPIDQHPRYTRVLLRIAVFLCFIPRSDVNVAEKNAPLKGLFSKRCLTNICVHSHHGENSVNSKCVNWGRRVFWSRQEEDSPVVSVKPQQNS